MQYKEDHFGIFRACDFEWPPNKTTGFINEGKTYMEYRGMPNPVQEVAWFMHRFYEKTAENFPPWSVQLCDAGLSLQPLIQWDLAEHCPKVTDPWKELCPTLTQRVCILVRYLDGESKVEARRLMSGHELMFFIGFLRGRFDEVFEIDHKTMVKIAGLAFSGFARMPVVLTALWAAGKIGVTGDHEQLLTPDTSSSYSGVVGAAAVNDDDMDTSGSV